MSSILIVEDYESLKTLYVSAFSHAGFEVETAMSGIEALTKTKNKEFDVILLDMLMLGLSGAEFLEKFHANKHPDTTIIAISNLDSSQVVKKAESLGAVKYLLKSQYTPPQLVEAVKEIINK
jgi:CheY-like chemotaxis protein